MLVNISIRAVKRILRYLKGTLTYDLLLKPATQGQPFSLQAFSDVDWATDTDDKRSTSSSILDPTWYHGGLESKHWLLDLVPRLRIEVWQPLQQK